MKRGIYFDAHVNDEEDGNRTGLSEDIGKVCKVNNSFIVSFGSSTPSQVTI